MCRLTGSFRYAPSTSSCHPGQWSLTSAWIASSSPRPRTPYLNALARQCRDLCRNLRPQVRRDVAQQVVVLVRALVTVLLQEAVCLRVAEIHARHEVVLRAVHHRHFLHACDQQSLLKRREEGLSHCPPARRGIYYQQAHIAAVRTRRPGPWRPAQIPTIAPSLLKRQAQFRQWSRAADGLLGDKRLVHLVVFHPVVRNLGDSLQVVRFKLSDRQGVPLLRQALSAIRIREFRHCESNGYSRRQTQPAVFLASPCAGRDAVRQLGQHRRHARRLSR